MRVSVYVGQVTADRHERPRETKPSRYVTSYYSCFTNLGTLIFLRTAVVLLHHAFFNTDSYELLLITLLSTYKNT